MANDWRRYSPDDFDLGMMPSCDPGTGFTGFAMAGYNDRTGEVVVSLGASHDPNQGNNSVRGLNLATGAYRCLWPSGPSNGGMRNRDNHMLVVMSDVGPQGSVFIAGGTYQTNPDCGPGTNHYAGLFDVSRATRDQVSDAWTLYVESPNGDAGSAHRAVAEGLCRSYEGFRGHAAVAYDAVRSVGCFYGGENQGNALGGLQVMRPNSSAGPQLFEMCSTYSGTLPVSGVAPPPRLDLQNAGVVLGRSFYFFGGIEPAYDHWQSKRDLWRLDLDALCEPTPRAVWQEMASAVSVEPERRFWTGGVDSLMVTADTVNNLLVVHGGYQSNRVLVYSVDDDSWVNHTDTMDSGGCQLFRFNCVCAFDPVLGRSIYTGGNYWREDTWEELSGYSHSLTGYAAGSSPAPPVERTAQVAEAGGLVAAVARGRR